MRNAIYTDVATGDVIGRRGGVVDDGQPRLGPVRLGGRGGRDDDGRMVRRESTGQRGGHGPGRRHRVERAVRERDVEHVETL